MIQKPKPTKETRQRMVKDSPLAPKGKRRSASKPRRKVLEKQIAEMVKALIVWRDGQVCVFGEIDGGRCGNGLMWNHFVRQKQSHWLQLDLGNVVWGCGTHNFLDNHGDKTFTRWYVRKFGADAMDAIILEGAAHKGKKHSMPELEEMLVRYERLYQDRFYVELTLPALVEKGYYGEVIRKVFHEN